MNKFLLLCVLSLSAFAMNELNFSTVGDLFEDSGIPPMRFELIGQMEQPDFSCVSYSKDGDEEEFTLKFSEIERMGNLIAESSNSDINDKTFYISDGSTYSLGSGVLEVTIMVFNDDITDELNSVSGNLLIQMKTPQGVESNSFCTKL